ncbi:MAG: glyoxalase, partial [Sphingobacteriales bacterium]
MNELSNQNALAIRPFIGAKNFDRSRDFYKDLGFTETLLSPSLFLFKWNELGFYLQNAYVKDWVDNTMLFFQVESVEAVWAELTAMELTIKYPEVKIVPIRTESWGK